MLLYTEFYTFEAKFLSSVFKQELTCECLLIFSHIS